MEERLQAWLRKLWRTTADTFRLYLEIDGEQRSAAFAYCVLFALFPLMALMLMLGSLLFGTGEIVDAVGSVLPLDPKQQNFLWEAVVALERARGGISLISLGILLWCSLRFFQALVRGVNRAWHTIEIPWWQMPLKNLMMVGILSSALVAGLLIPAVLQTLGAILRTAGSYLHAYWPGFDTQALTSLLDLTRYGLGGAVLFYSFALLYMLAPRRRVYFREVWLAALLVTLSLQACQITFVNILPRFVNYGLYGAVGGMMLLLMWVYFSGILIMLGGCLCAAPAGPAPQQPIPSNLEN